MNREDILITESVLWYWISTLKLDNPMYKINTFNQKIPIYYSLGCREMIITRRLKDKHVSLREYWETALKFETATHQRLQF